MDQKFNDVRDYIHGNPTASMETVCEATEVEMQDIKRWLAEGRLILAKGSPIFLKCEKCGQPILTGKQCDKCLANLRSSLSGAADSMRPPEPKPKPKADTKGRDKMHVAIRKN
jgi:methionyl-tRNA synthetase